MLISRLADRSYRLHLAHGRYSLLAFDRWMLPQVPIQRDQFHSIPQNKDTIPSGDELGAGSENPAATTKEIAPDQCKSLAFEDAKIPVKDSVGSEIKLSWDNILKRLMEKGEEVKVRYDELQKMQHEALHPHAEMQNYSIRNLKIYAIQEPLNSATPITDGLKKLYFQKLKPLEITYRFNDFVSPFLTIGDFDAKPMVMLLGQYSTGKTTFIEHLLKTSYPGAHVGPEPTTDKFIAVMNGTDEIIVPGNTVAVQADMPFSGLATFGTAFLEKFECSQMPHPLLEHITFVDTPGVLSGEKQRTQRGYDFAGAISWFASKCDLVLLLFDPHKLDINDEFKGVISSLRGHGNKIRLVLNKADQVDTQQLMRVYGALMWSLGKVINTPEVTRVYVGSFNDKPTNEAAVGPIGKELFEKEQGDLLADLWDTPKKACDLRINEFVKRARAAKIHAYIIGHLKKQMPLLMGKAEAQKKLIDNLDKEFIKIQREHHLPAGDLPNVDHYRDVLSGCSIDEFERLKPKLIQAVDDMLGYDIPELLKILRNPSS